MNKLIVFNSVSLDGFFVDMNGGIEWARTSTKDEEWDAFVESNARGEGVLLFGRITYELMKSYWPTPSAMKAFPAVAERMNNLPKIVFSRTLDTAEWKNTKIVKNALGTEIRRMKNESGNGMVILGSGIIVSQLTQERLIDEYQIVVIPTILGKGRTLFEGLQENLNLKLIHSRTFNNGNVFLRYVPKL